jgi:hypothetical protein
MNQHVIHTHILIGRLATLKLPHVELGYHSQDRLTYSTQDLSTVGL